MADLNIPKTPHRVRVNGALLQKFHQKQVCLLGEIIRADGGGTSFQVKSSDGQAINVRLKTPISEPLEGIVEVCGTGQGKNLIVAEFYTSFPEECTKTFDMNLYNETIKAIHSLEGDLNPLVPGGA